MGRPAESDGPFRLDVTQGQLWRGDQVLALRRGSMAMLCYLAEHPGRLVTKAELRQLLVRRLEALPSEGSRVLEAASVVGEQFTVAIGATRRAQPESIVAAAGPAASRP
jgi:hypothetical protein